MKYTFVYLFLCCLFSNSLAQHSETQIKASEDELIYQARALLLSALKESNETKAMQAVEYLETYNSKTTALHPVEKTRIYFYFKKYDLAYHQIISSNQAERTNQLSPIEDSLFFFLRQLYRPWEIQSVDSLYNQIQSSSIDLDKKEAFSIILYITCIGKDSIVGMKEGRPLYKENLNNKIAQPLLDRAQKIIAKYPSNPDFIWINKNMVKPLKTIIAEDSLFKKEPLKHKRYTGGIGLDILLSQHLILGNMGSYYRNDYNSLLGFSFYIGLPMQIKRFVFTPSVWMPNIMSQEKLIKKFEEYKEIDYRSTPEHNDHDLNIYKPIDGLFIALSGGIVVYDSEKIKVTPFVGYEMGFASSIDRPILQSKIFGADFEYRIYSDKPKSRVDNSVLKYISLKIKYTGHIADMFYIGPDYETKGFVNTLNVGLGFYIW